MNELYNDLIALVEKGSYTKFFYKDFVTPFGTNVRIFTYNYASYEDWLKPNALESRGIMFEMDGEEPVRIMSRPMQKFFNLNENPFTIDLDLSKILYGTTKEDGSLISTYEDNGTLRTKSKSSIFSTQAVESHQVLLDYNNKELYDRCLELAKDGFTCNFEYVAPNNRIVIEYSQKDLVLLNVRENNTGEYVSYEELRKDPVLRKYLVGRFVFNSENPEETINDIIATEGIEGYVFVMEDDTVFKLKTDWYKSLHAVKDTLNNNEALFMTVVGGASDDLKTMFNDEASITKIDAFERVFFKYLTDSLLELNKFYAEFRGKDRKTFAINSQERFKLMGRFELFGISMQQFTGALDADDIVGAINEVFLKNSSKYVPSEYINVVVSEI